MSVVEAQLAKLGLALPAAPRPVASYVSAVRTGNLVVTSGQLPWQGETFVCTGKLGADVTIEQGYQAARVCALNALAQLKTLLGDLDKIRQLVRVEGYVHCADGFLQHPQVLNGASDLFNQVLGAKGRHTRVALGIHQMPLDAPVQLVVWAEVE